MKTLDRFYFLLLALLIACFDPGGIVAHTSNYINSKIWDSSGNIIDSAKNADGTKDELLVSGEDAYLAISRNKNSSVSFVNKFGRNPDIDTATDPEDVWDVGGLWVPPTVARTHDIVSTDVDDDGTLVSSGTATGGSTTTLVDSAADFVTDGVAVGDAALNDTNFDHSIVTAVAATTLTLEQTYHANDPAFSGDVGFSSGDSYRVVTPASTGASITHIFGLDASMEEQEEFIIMNGTTNVPTVNTYYRIFRMHIDGAASRTVTNEGDISATAQTDATVTAQINAGNGQTGMAIYTVPSNKTAYMTQVFADLVQSKASVARLSVRETPMASIDGLGSRIQHFFGLENGSGHYHHTFKPYKKFLSNTDIFVRIDEVSANDMDISAGFDIILVDN